MANILTAKCPFCKTNTLDVTVGRKSTVRTVRCPLCHRNFEYSCWVRKRAGRATFHQVDLVPWSDASQFGPL
jgi:hypothetical protein